MFYLCINAVQHQQVGSFLGLENLSQCCRRRRHGLASTGGSIMEQCFEVMGSFQGYGCRMSFVLIENV